MRNLGGNGDLNLNTSLNVDDDLLDSLGGREEANRQLLAIWYSSFYLALHTTGIGGNSINEDDKKGMTYSIRRLWIRISYLSQVFEPSPLGALRVEI